MIEAKEEKERVREMGWDLRNFPGFPVTKTGVHPHGVATNFSALRGHGWIESDRVVGPFIRPSP